MLVDVALRAAPLNDPCHPIRIAKAAARQPDSAAQILPVEAATPQSIVRVFGSHSVLDSRYPNGSRVACDYRLDARGDAHWKSGRELLDDLLRALPARLAGW